MSFDQFYSFEDFLREDHELYQNAIYRYLVSLNDNGKLKSNHQYDGLELKYPHYWNALVDGKVGDPKCYWLEEWRVMETLGYPFMFHGFYLHKPKGSTEDSEAYRKLVDFISSGNIGPRYFDITNKSQVDGQTYKFGFEDWELKCYTIDCDWETKRLRYQEAAVPAPIEIKTNTIHLETGELLIADWFRIKGFNEIVDKSVDGKAPDINSILGRDEQQLRYARDFNFFSIHVGDACPRLYEKDGVIIVGSFDDENFSTEGHTEKGGVSGDLWNVTIIEKQKLIKIVSQTMAMEYAEKAVADYIDKNNVLRLTVNPGVYHCYSSGNYQEFKKMAGDIDVDMSKFKEVLFLLSDHELPMKDELEMSPC